MSNAIEDLSKISPEELELLRGLKDSFAGIAALSPDQRKRFLEIASNPNLPPNWSLDSVAPYYNRKNAEWLKPTLDEMMKDTEHNRKFFPKDFGVSYRTLRVKINQSWQWLIDFSPDAAVYKKLRSMVEISKDRGGILLRWKNSRDGECSTTLGVPVPIEEKLFKWKERLGDYIDNAKDKDEFHEKGLDLTDEDREWIMNQFSELEEFHIVKLLRTSIHILKDREMAEIKKRLEEGKE